MKQIALVGQERIKWCRLRNRAAKAVYDAIRRGELIDLKKKFISCKDCDSRATVYDHRNYSKPLEVDPVCKGCNVVRGTNAPILKEDKSKMKCPDCKSQDVRFRSGSKSFICRRCGNEWKKDQKSSFQKKETE